MIQKHIDKLIEIGNDKSAYLGNNSLKWASSILADSPLIDKKINTRFDRYELFKYCNDKGNSDLNVLVAILSWGGMRRDHGKKLFENPDSVLQLVEGLRSNLFNSRKSAFEIFQKKRAEGVLPGLGIGYFTKLICFLAPEINGYIMDQWVAKSVNLITGKSIVNIANNNWVNDNNDSDTYVQFCTIIDELADILGCEGIEAEKRIFSVGRGKGLWRNYLLANLT